MNKAILIILLSFSGLNLNAQTDIDSLLVIWNNESLNDTVRLNAMIDLVEDYYLYSKTDSALVLGKQMLDLAQKKKNLKFEIEANTLLGEIYFELEEGEKATQQYTTGLELALSMKDSVLYLDKLSELGRLYRNYRDYINAFKTYQKCRIVSKNIGDGENEGWSVDAIGQIYRDLGEFKEAEKYLLEHLRLSTKYDIKYSISGANGNLGGLYFEMGEIQKSLKYWEEGIKLAKELGEPAYASIGTSNLIRIYIKENDFANAIKYLNEYKEVTKKFTGPWYKIRIARFQCQIDYGLGKYDIALKKCDDCLKMYEAIGSNPRVELIETLYLVNKKLNRNKDALKYFEKYQLLIDDEKEANARAEIQNIVFNNQLVEDSIATAEEARLVEEAHKEEVRQKNTTRNMLLGGGLFLFIIAGGIYNRLRFTRKAKAEIEKEKDRSESLLLNILPEEIAEELKEKGRADAREFEMVSILFTDFKGFTAASEKLSAQDLVSEINTCFEAFDGIMDKYGIEKIKTIGDAYMAAGGLPIPTNDSVKNTVLAALEMQAFISDRKAKLDAEGKPGFEMRAGVHTGPVVAGIVGAKKFQYDIWGDAVNTASRMESSGEVGKVNISQATYELLKDDEEFTFESRGKIEAKGKGEIEMYFISKKLN